MSRVYLDWNATAPLRPEARAAMLEAMDLVGNPSSVHAEGRAAKALIEKARGQVARLVGCEPGEVVFTSGATEAAASVLSRADSVMYPATAHDCIVENVPPSSRNFPMKSNAVGQLDVGPGYVVAFDAGANDIYVCSVANSETGVLVTDETNPAQMEWGQILEDAVQAFGKVYHTPERYRADFSMVSGHKLGGPKGSGALIVKDGRDPAALLKGGGQEMGRRSGTENVIGIAGFGAAAQAALRDLEDGVWERVEKLRNILEDALASASNETIFVGNDAPRLPNTSCFVTPGWKGETQVMQMDLAGYAISAGSACSSGKVKESRVLRAMGFDPIEASSAVRVSLGPTTTEEEVLGFARTWSEHYRRWKQRAA